MDSLLLVFVCFCGLLRLAPAPHVPVWEVDNVATPPTPPPKTTTTKRPTIPPVHRIPRPQLGEGDSTEWGTPNWTYESLLTGRMLRQRGIRKRPSFHPAYPVYVGLTLSLVDLLNFDWRTHVLTTKLEMIYHWDDPRLSWYKEDYGNIHTVLIDSKSIWTPDVVLYSNLDDEVEDRRMKQQQYVHVSNLGYAAWYFTRTYRTKCDMSRVNITTPPAGPGEGQATGEGQPSGGATREEPVLQCQLKFASWSHSGWELQIYNSTNEVRDLSTTEQIWSLHSASIVNNKPENIWYTLHYPDVTYTLTFRRNINFHNEL